MIKTLLAMALNAFGPSSALPRTKRRPTGATLRNPADPHQAARIEAAAAKRARRAMKLLNDLEKSVWNNPAHCWMAKTDALGKTRNVPPRNLQPLSVRK